MVVDLELQIRNRYASAMTTKTKAKTKVCGGCRKRRRVSKFSKRASSKDGLQNYCKDCHNAYHRERLADCPKNKAKRRRWSKDRIHRHQKKIVALKANPCSDCRETFEHWQMQWDHVTGDKEGDVSTLVAHGCSWERIAREIAKCELVCGHCHKTRTYRRNHPDRCW